MEARMARRLDTDALMGGPLVFVPEDVPDGDR
jgi:hypothetical protein